MTRRAATWTGLATVVVVALGWGAALSAGRPEAGPAVREFTVIAERYKFTPDRFEVSQGDIVRLTVRSADSTHGLGIKKLHVDKLIPKGGEPVLIEFVAGQAGTFPIVCSEYCGRGHDKMKAMLVVVPAGNRGGTK